MSHTYIYTSVYLKLSKRLVMEQKFRSRIVMSERINTQFLYVFEEKQLYSKNLDGKTGDIYVCVNRSMKCKSRVILENNGECVKLARHHENDCEQRFNNLVANKRMAQLATDLHSIASSSNITKSREILKQAMIE